MKYIAILLLASMSATTLAHHSRVQYDSTTVHELSGEIVAVRWKNPHVTYTLQSTNIIGEQEDWDLETGSIYGLARTGVTQDVVTEGDRVTIAGYTSTRGGRDFLLTNMLLPNGQEIVMLPAAEPRWSTDALGGREQWSTEVAVGTAERNESQGIFRVWSIEHLVDRMTYFESLGVSLTDQAMIAREAFDPLQDDPGLDCIEPGMPRSMTGPHPIQFIDHGEEIEVLIAEFDIRRIIHLGEDENSEGAPFTKQGYSRGHWLDNDLEVRTSKVSWPYFDGRGTPQSQAVEMVEKFSLTDDERRLDYEITVTDPFSFTEPVTLQLHWVDLGEPMEIYNCEVAAASP